MQITYRIPSKKVPYGYVEVTWEKADQVMPDPVAMAEDYAQFILDYQSAEVQAFEKPSAPKKADPVDEARKILEEGVGSTTEVNENEPAAPWDKAPEETNTKKAWESSFDDDDDWEL